MDSVPLPGSAYHQLDRPRPGHRRTRGLTVAEWHQPLELTVMLRERPGAPSVHQSLDWWHAAAPRARHFSVDQLRGQHAWAHADRERVTSWARHHELRVVGEDPATRRITLRGRTGRLGELFGVQLEHFRWDRAGTSVEYRGHVGSVRLPVALAGVVTGVFGLDDRPVAQPRLRRPEGGHAALVSRATQESTGRAATRRCGRGSRRSAGGAGGGIAPRDDGRGEERLLQAAHDCVGDGMGVRSRARERRCPSGCCISRRSLDRGDLRAVLHRPEAGVDGGEEAEQEQRGYKRKFDGGLRAAAPEAPSACAHRASPISFHPVRMVVGVSAVTADSRRRRPQAGKATYVMSTGVSGATVTGLAGWLVFGSTNVIQLPPRNTSKVYGPPIGIALKSKPPLSLVDE